ELLTFLGLAVAGGTAAVIAKNNNSDDDHKNNDSSADNKDNGNTNAGEKDNGNTAADDTGNGNAGTDDKGNSNAGTENSGNIGTDDKGNSNTGTENTGTETGGNSNTGTGEQGNNNTGTNDNDDTAPDDQGNTDVPVDITAVAAIDDVADSSESDPENLSAMTPVLTGHLDSALTEGRVVVISRDGNVVGYATVENDGKWTFNDTTGDFEQGQTYHYTARVEGNGARGAESDPFSIHYDTTGQHEGTDMSALPGSDDAA
ncbi:hypothetical protein DAZ36_25880, partial [Salmonella enterica subsp. enterica serovar Enteritidis]|nr:hypothetical protein [Salmonella enterica subsp. enterica serovar Enteritidis]